MAKFLLKLIAILLTISVALVLYISYFGINTDKFDSLIKSKTNSVNQYIQLEFNKTKIHINLKELNLVVKLQKPKILVKKNEIDLSKLDLFLSIKSFFISDFLLKRIEIDFKENDIKDLSKFTNVFLPRFVNKRINKIFTKGKIEGNFTIPFNPDGSVGKDYGFFGKLSDATIKLTKEFSIKNLTTEINDLKEINANGLELKIKKGYFYNLNLANSIIKLEREPDKIKTTSLLKTNGKLNYSQIKKISSLLSINVGNFKNINGEVNLNTNIDFDFNNNLKIKNFTYKVDGDIPYFELDTIEKKSIKNYLPEYDSKLIFKDSKIKVTNSKYKKKVNLEGFIKQKENFSSFQIEENFNNKKKLHNIKGIADLTNTKINVAKLNYVKDNKKKATISFDINFALNKSYNIKELDFSSEKNKIYLSGLKLNKNLEVSDFKVIKVKTYNNKIKNNDFLANKLDKVLVSGKVFDAHTLLKSLYKKNDKKTFSKNFTSEAKINFNNVLTGTNDDVSKFSMIANINKGSFVKLSSKGNFSDDEIVEFSIYQNESQEKTFQVFSDRARPFIKNFNFVKGFKDGKLEYEAVFSQGVTNSKLLIKDFKISKVPALAKLLTLASLQGIADTLSGEGIRFESFEMKSNSSGNIMNIEDALAMGPAVSILLNGYVDKGKTVSLRGTLVPATKLNSIIASIPVVGDILVGKKTGEGVVGVSFKMKGPPKNIKTTVNPIKTLTPRFIVRALEKNKNKKKESK